MPRMLQKLGMIIAIPLVVFALHENLWAESLSKQGVITPAFYVEITEPVKSDNEILLELEMLEEKTDELDLLARCVEAEAGNQSVLGKRLVVDTVLNRTESSAFPDSITEVILQPGQFAVVGNGRIENVEPTAETYTAIAMETANRISNEVLYFQAGGFPSYGEHYERVGDHYFSK